MKTKVSSFIKLTSGILLLIAYCSFAQAQKKEIQTVNLQAPEGLKIDGKLGEWGDDLQAYNKATKLYYTMANDDKNLYLVVKCKDKLDITKILGGGISLSINTADKKKDKDAFVITFPVVNRTSLRDARGGGGGRRGGFGGGNSTLTPAQIDSASRAAHKTSLALIREIGVTGFKDITDSVISIYNEYSIKAQAGFDEEDSFVSELSIPLSLLNISTADAKEFAYNIKVNAIQNGRNGGGRNGGNNDGGGNIDGGGGGGNRGGGGGGFGGGGFGGGGGGGNRGGGGGGGNRGGGEGINPMEELSSATDFWGKYTLYKK